MRLNELEKFVIEQFRSANPSSDSTDLSKIRILSRDYSPIGFLITIAEESRPRLLPAGSKYTGGDLILKLNDDVDTGYVYYIVDGFLKALEGHLYSGEAWPDSVDTFSVIRPNAEV